MNTSELLLEAFGRVHEAVPTVVEGLGDDDLAHRPDADANSITWLVWHLTRVQDDHVAAVADVEQVWTSDGWFERFDLPLDVADTGWSHSSEQVAAVRVASADLLTGYHEAVHRMTVAYLGGVDDAELDRVVDTRWDPPVTAGVRLVSVAEDTMMHVGQAAYLRGLVQRSKPRG